MPPPDALIRAARDLRREVDGIGFGDPVTHVYNPLGYGWEAHRSYLRTHGGGRKRVVFMGMNPGPWGMAQTAVPFGEVGLVRDWVGVEAEVGKPDPEHPKRPVEGFACGRSEVSGRRLWGLFKGRFGQAEAFFEEHFVANYCPLVFMEASGRNRTPDKLPAGESAPLFAACDRHLARLLRALEPEWIIGVGAFAEGRAREVAGAGGTGIKVGRILHPSPASPAANRDWAGAATRQLVELGIWSDTP